jgi:hypothetical protein
MITLTREEAQQVLDALEELNKRSVGENAICLPAEIDDAMETLRARLAQPEPEPYDPLENNADYERGFIDGMQKQMQSSVDKAVNTMSAPPQRVYCSCGDGIVPDDGTLCGICVSLKKMREWQGLTDEEIGMLTVFDGLHHVEVPLLAEFVRAIEAKLKEKNT